MLSECGVSLSPRGLWDQAGHASEMAAFILYPGVLSSGLHLGVSVLSPPVHPEGSLGCGVEGTPVLPQACGACAVVLWPCRALPAPCCRLPPRTAWRCPSPRRRRCSQGQLVRPGYVSPVPPPQP